MSNLKSIIKAVNDELMQSFEVVYEPYVLDAQNQWMRPETIKKACENFNANLAEDSILPNMFHSKDESGDYKSTENFTILKTWINEVDCQIGDETVSEGTWLCHLQWHDESAWELRKSNTYQGVSIGARGSVLKPEDREEQEA